MGGSLPPAEDDLLEQLSALGRQGALPALLSDLDWLGWQLSGIDEQLFRDLAEFPSQRGRSELAGAIFAAKAVTRFLRYHAPSEALCLLEKALSQLALGSRPAMLSPPQDSGRPPEAGLLQAVKGIIAGLTHVQQTSGMDRKQATAWIARNISPELQACLAKKPIKRATIEEWLARYGGANPPDDPGGRAFKIWSRPYSSPLTAEKFQAITSDLARMLPAR
jgi:hypothetical protein